MAPQTPRREQTGQWISGPGGNFGAGVWNRGQTVSRLDERGAAPYSCERIVRARFNLEWLSDGADSLA